MNKKLLAKLLDNSLRVNTIFHLGAQVLSDPMPPSLYDVLHYGEVPNLENLLKVPNTEFINVEDILDTILFHKKFGYLVEVFTPVPKNIVGNGTVIRSFSFSWGLYEIKWFYADSLEEVFNQAITWREEYLKEEYTKQLEKG